MMFKLSEGFFSNQLKTYIDEIDKFKDSEDVFQMYNTAHKLVGPCRYAAAMQVALCADKM